MSVSEEMAGWVIRDATRSESWALRLVEMSGALSRAVSTHEVAQALCQQARAALGLGPGLLFLTADDGATMDLSCCFGYPSEVEARLRDASSEGAMPWQEASRTGAPVLISDPADARNRYPSLLDLTFGVPEEQLFPLVAIPLVLAGRSTGVIVLRVSPQEADGAPERAYLLAVAQLGAQALARARLYEAERRARAETEAARVRAAFLADASSVLASSLDYQATLRAVVHLAVPRVADWCSVELADGATFGPLAVAHVDDEKRELAEDLRRRFPPDPGRDHGIAHVLRTGCPEMYPVIDPARFPEVVRNDEELRLWQALEPRSVMIVPMQVRGRTVGALLFMSCSRDRRYARTDLEMAESLADRAALAIENARLYLEAREAIRAREDLLAIVSHDLRNMLAVLTLRSAQLARLLGRIHVDLPVINHVEAIRRAAGQMERLIRDLLDMPKAEAGTLTMELRREDVRALLEQTIETFRPVAAQKSVDMRSDLPLEPVEWLCDRERLGQVLTNLLVNATKFTPDGGLVIVHLQREADELRIAVSDTGSGIPAEHLPRIFDRYWQGERRQRQSVGLGLFIAKAIVEAHGGRIWAESEVGQGTTVTFSLPTRAAAAAAAE